MNRLKNFIRIGKYIAKIEDDKVIFLYRVDEPTMMYLPKEGYELTVCAAQMREKRNKLENVLVQQ